MIIVTSTADAGAGTLRQALADATAGEEITFSVTGTITLTSAELTISQNQIITGPGSTNLTISGGGSFRVFNITTGIVSMTGLKITGGNDVDGAGMHAAASLTLSDIIVDSCVASGDGGGIFNSSSIVMSGCVISNNSSVGRGGGIFNSGTITDAGSIFTANQSTDNGGAIYSSGTYTGAGLYISLNDSDGFSGGGIFNGGTLSLTECTVDANTGNLSGDAIYDNFGTTTLTRCTVMNHAAATSSAVYEEFGTLIILNSTFSGNVIAIFNNFGAIGSSNCTITANETGISQASGSVLTIYDTILAGNSVEDLTSDAGDVTSSGHNIFGNTSNPITPAAGDQSILTYAGLIIGPLQNNGGPTSTHALLTGSPAIDAGDNTSAPATDQRGAGYARVINSTIDIGAFEVQEVPCLTFTGTLPSWLTIQGDCLVVTPGSFRGATKAEANAAAQAALDAFVAAALESGDLVCGTPACTESLMSATTWNLTQIVDTNANYVGSISGDTGAYSVTGDFFGYAIFRTDTDLCYDCNADYRIQVTVTLDGPLDKNFTVMMNPTPSATAASSNPGDYAYQGGAGVDLATPTAVLTSGYIPAGTATGIHIRFEGPFDLTEYTGSVTIAIAIIP